MFADLKGPKMKYKLHYGWRCGETFYGRHTAQHQLQLKQLTSAFLLNFIVGLAAHLLKG